MMILKEFSRIVCVSLFSYQGSLFVCLSDSSFTLSHSPAPVKYFFQVFSRYFDVCVSLSGDLFTLSHVRFFVNNYFCFFQNFSNCLFRRNNSLRQLNQNTTIKRICQHFFELFLFFFLLHYILWTTFCHIYYSCYKIKKICRLPSAYVILILFFFFFLFFENHLKQINTDYHIFGKRINYNCLNRILFIINFYFSNNKR